MYNLNGTAAKATLERKRFARKRQHLGRRKTFFFSSVPCRFCPRWLKRVVSKRETETREGSRKRWKERSLLRRVGNWPMVCKWAAEGTREREGYTRCKKGEKKKKGNANLQVGIVLASYNGPVAPILCKSSRSDQRRASFHSSPFSLSLSLSLSLLFVALLAFWSSDVFHRFDTTPPDFST